MERKKTSELLFIHFNIRKDEIVSIFDIQIDSGALIDLCVRWSSVAYISKYPVGKWKELPVRCLWVCLFIHYQFS